MKRKGNRFYGTDGKLSPIFGTNTIAWSAASRARARARNKTKRNFWEKNPFTAKYLFYLSRAQKVFIRKQPKTKNVKQYQYTLTTSTQHCLETYIIFTSFAGSRWAALSCSRETMDSMRKFDGFSFLRRVSKNAVNAGSFAVSDSIRTYSPYIFWTCKMNPFSNNCIILFFHYFSRCEYPYRLSWRQNLVNHTRRHADEEKITILWNRLRNRMSMLAFFSYESEWKGRGTSDNVIPSHVMLWLRLCLSMHASRIIHTQIMLILIALE